MRNLAKNRDMKVLQGIEKHKYLRSDQIADMYFTTIKSRDHRIKKTAERLKKLYDKGLVQRMRFPSEPYIYHVNGSTFTHKLMHYLTIADVWLTLQEIKPAGSVLRYEVEKDFGNVITDLYIEFSNEFRGERKQMFIEIELDSSGDILDKLNKYAFLFRTRKRDNISGDVLYVLHKKKAIGDKLEGYAGNIDLKVLDIREIKSKWVW